MGLGYFSQQLPHWRFSLQLYVDISSAIINIKAVKVNILNSCIQILSCTVYLHIFMPVESDAPYAVWAMNIINIHLTN